MTEGPPSFLNYRLERKASNGKFDAIKLAVVGNSILTFCNGKETSSRVRSTLFSTTETLLKRQNTGSKVTQIFMCNPEISHREVSEH